MKSQARKTKRITKCIFLTFETEQGYDTPSEYNSLVDHIHHHAHHNSLQSKLKEEMHTYS